MIILGDNKAKGQVWGIIVAHTEKITIQISYGIPAGSRARFSSWFCFCITNDHSYAPEHLKDWFYSWIFNHSSMKYPVEKVNKFPLILYHFHILIRVDFSSVDKLAPRISILLLQNLCLMIPRQKNN